MSLWILGVCYVFWGIFEGSVAFFFEKKNEAKREMSFASDVKHVFYFVNVSALKIKHSQINGILFYFLHWYMFSIAVSTAISRAIFDNPLSINLAVLILQIQLRLISVGFGFGIETPLKFAKTFSNQSQGPRVIQLITLWAFGLCIFEQREIWHMFVFTF